jgi:hypothetical protein
LTAPKTDFGSLKAIFKLPPRHPRSGAFSLAGLSKFVVICKNTSKYGMQNYRTFFTMILHQEKFAKTGGTTQNISGAPVRPRPAKGILFKERNGFELIQ